MRSFARAWVRYGMGRSVSATRAAVAGLLLALALPASSARAASSLVISEVTYNPGGLFDSDDGLEWIELYNGTTSIIDFSLEAWSLGWGGSDYTTGTIDLVGSIAPNSYFVIGGPGGGFAYDQVYNFAPDLENGYGAGEWFVADGIALFNQSAASIGPATVPHDAVIYGWFVTNSSGLLDESGTPGPVDVWLSSGSGGSLQFDDANWGFQTVTTPGSGPLSQTPEPSTGMLVLLGLVALAARRSAALRARDMPCSFAGLRARGTPDRFAAARARGAA